MPIQSPFLRRPYPPLYREGSPLRTKRDAESLGRAWQKNSGDNAQIASLAQIIQSIQYDLRQTKRKLQPQSSEEISGVFVASITDVDDVGDDVLWVKKLNANGDVFGDQFSVAVPWELRAAAIPTVPSAGDGWPHGNPAVAPAYAVNDYLIVATARWTGVEYETAPVTHIDLNIAPRIWSVTLDYCYDDVVFRVPVAITGDIALA
jgi:hypothetical protein